MFSEKWYCFLTIGIRFCTWGLQCTLCFLDINNWPLMGVKGWVYEEHNWLIRCRLFWALGWLSYRLLGLLAAGYKFCNKRLVYPFRKHIDQVRGLGNLFLWPTLMPRVPSLVKGSSSQNPKKKTKKKLIFGRTAKLIMFYFDNVRINYCRYLGWNILMSSCRSFRTACQLRVLWILSSKRGMLKQNIKKNTSSF